MKRVYTRKDFQKWGAMGVAVRKPRVLTSDQAREMVRIREAKKLAVESAKVVNPQ